MRSRARPAAAGVLLLLAQAACASAPRPAQFARIAEVRSSPAAEAAQTWAPQAHAHALELAQRAEKAWAADDRSGAEILAERALAAHEHAWVLARLARAERRRLAAEGELAEQQRALAELQAQEQRLNAEAASLELRAKVVQNALPLAAHEAASPERLEARRRAAAALSTQGRLLCVAARLLGEAEAVKPLLARLDELDRELDARKGPRALEQATELRSACLRVISGVRQRNSAVPASPGAQAPPAAPIPADMLLAELSAAGQAPARDERGVAVVLRDVFAADGQLSEAGRAQLARLGGLAQAHADFPVLLVGHTASLEERGAMGQQLAVLSRELEKQGVKRLAVHDAGPRQPLLPPQLARARQRNQRIDLIFVAPGL